MSITKKWCRGWLFHAGIVQATTTRKYLSRSRHQRQTNQQTKHTYTYTYTGEQSNTAHSHITQRVTIPYETGGDDGRKTTTRSRRGRQGSDDNRERSDCLCPRIGMRSGDAGGVGFFIVERRREHSKRATAMTIARREMHRRSNEFKKNKQKEKWASLPPQGGRGGK